MGEALATKRKSGRISWKENRVVSLFISCFSSCINGNIDSSSSDEVLKPLYYIISDINSEQMDATIATVDDAPSDRKGKAEETFQQTRSKRKGSILVRYCREIFSGFKKNWNFKRPLDRRFTYSTNLNEIVADEISANRQVSELNDKSLDEKASLVTKANLIFNIYKGYQQFLNKLQCRFSCFSGLAKKVGFEVDQNVQLHTEAQNSNSANAEPLKLNTMGVSFAHPVYTGKCRQPEDYKNTNTKNYSWKKMETCLSIENDDFAFPTTKTIVEIETAAGWGSGDSSSLHPTDEQSSLEMNFHHGIFDLDVDNIPFDEILCAGTISPRVYQKRE